MYTHLRLDKLFWMLMVKAQTVRSKLVVDTISTIFLQRHFRQLLSNLITQKYHARVFLYSIRYTPSSLVNCIEAGSNFREGSK